LNAKHEVQLIIEYPSINHECHVFCFLDAHQW